MFTWSKACRVRERICVRIEFHENIALVGQHQTTIWYGVYQQDLFSVAIYQKWKKKNNTFWLWQTHSIIQRNMCMQNWPQKQYKQRWTRSNAVHTKHGIKNRMAGTRTLCIHTNHSFIYAHVHQNVIHCKYNNIFQFLYDNNYSKLCQSYTHTHTYYGYGESARQVQSVWRCFFHLSCF